MQPTQFRQALLDWFAQHGRHNLPWQSNPTPYRVWISEIMLQQTQVTTVIPYYQKFMQQFPSLKKLAQANVDEVLALWSGLGYYARARNLYKCSQVLHKDYNGRFPKQLDTLISLPGIGRSTAGAILSLAMQHPAAILDGNVKRVLTRYFAIAGWPGDSQVSKQLWALAEQYTPTQQDCKNYNQAMMDLGSLVCTRTRPNCTSCPLQKNCKARRYHNPSDFPQRKVKSQKAQKHTHMFLINNDKKDILLVKRPPLGIWGGLWSLPECTQAQDIAHYCRQHLHAEIIRQQTLTRIVHQFSHFQLTIDAISIQIQQSSNTIMDDTKMLWHNKNNNLPGGIAAPIAKLLNQYHL